MSGLIEKMVDQQAKKFDEKLIALEERLNKKFDEIGKKVDKLLEERGKD